MFSKLFNTRRHSTRRPRPRRNSRLRLEALEIRNMLSTINWDGGGGDFNWNNPLNWDTNTLPGANDFALIDFPFSGTTITHAAGTTTVDNVTSFASLIISGGTFTLLG